jgi:hypothetical protein
MSGHTEVETDYANQRDCQHSKTPETSSRACGNVTDQRRSNRAQQERTPGPQELRAPGMNILSHCSKLFGNLEVNENL